MSHTLLPFEKSRILVVGVIRNGESVIGHEISILNKALMDAASVSFYIVESDSNDNTRQALQDLATKIPSFDFKSLGNLSVSIPNRVDRIAHCRNEYLKYVVSRKHQFDFILVADLDGVNSLLDAKAIKSCWLRDEWEVCTANQFGPYYDIFALRATGWSEGDCWSEVRDLIMSGNHPLKAWRKAIRDKQIVIPQDSDWIEVDSSFGGLAIYSTESFIHGNYSALNDASSGCEHVIFNNFLKQKGFRIFINPRLVNFSYNIHNDWHRPSRRIKYGVRYFLSWLLPNWYVRRFMPDLPSR